MKKANNKDIADLIHEQNNHLTALYGQIYLLKSATKTTNNRNQILGIIAKIEKRLNSIEKIGDNINS